MAAHTCNKRNIISYSYSQTTCVLCAYVDIFYVWITFDFHNQNFKDMSADVGQPCLMFNVMLHVLDSYQLFFILNAGFLYRFSTQFLFFTNNNLL